MRKIFLSILVTILLLINLIGQSKNYSVIEMVNNSQIIIKGLVVDICENKNYEEITILLEELLKGEYNKNTIVVNIPRKFYYSDWQSIPKFDLNEEVLCFLIMIEKDMWINWHGGVGKINLSLENYNELKIL